MRTSTTKLICLLFVSAISAAVFVNLPGPQGLREVVAQSKWPSYDTYQDRICHTGNTCPLCGTPGPYFGCTSSLPGQWRFGFCELPPQGEQGYTCYATIFDCGPRINCATGFPDPPNPCLSSNSCRH
jgi:hypothetical protein